MKKIIRVLVVEDSPAMSKMITDILNANREIIVVGVAVNGKEAVELASRMKPDIVTMDIHMPIMDGLEATKQIMAYNPTPIVILSASVFKAEMNKAFRAISYGALDVIDKSRVADDLTEKVKFLSSIKVIKHPLGKLEKESHRVMSVKATGKLKKDISGERMVAIATSTGGPQAILQILRRLPRTFPCGILIVQHITRGFIQGLADWLDSQCAIDVKVAR
ncbi:MAG: response regulator, partial [Candidatus Omnitrophota bacterium]